MLESTRSAGCRHSEAEALRILGEIHARMNPVATSQAEELYRVALATAGQLGTRLLVAHCHLGLGKLYGRTSDRRRAQEHLATATTMYREMDMRFYLAQAETAMRESG
jgi:hypothetical protein